MKQLEPKYQLSFPSDKEVRITYPKNPNLWIGQVADATLIISMVLLFLSIVTEFISWNLLLIFLTLGAISALVRYNFPSNSLIEIILKPDFFQYKYVVGANNRDKHVLFPMFIDFVVELRQNVATVRFLEIVVELYNTDDLPIFIDKVAEMFDMKYVDTCRLSNQQEVLTYQRKHVPNIIFPTLINIDQQSNGVQFYDMMNQQIWVKFDELHKEVYHYDAEFVQQSLMIRYREIRRIDVIFMAGKWIENGKNRIVINVILKNHTKKTIFETTLRTKSQELTTYRDTNLIFMEMKKLPHLQSIKITKEFYIH